MVSTHYVSARMRSRNGRACFLSAPVVENGAVAPSLHAADTIKATILLLKQ